MDKKNSLDPDQLASSEVIWSKSTLFKNGIKLGKNYEHSAFMPLRRYFSAKLGMHHRKQELDSLLK